MARRVRRSVRPPHRRRPPRRLDLRRCRRPADHPGLVTYDEVAKGRIDHAIRVTVPSTQNRYVWPARHAASDDSNPALPPMGLRLRLRRDADLSGLAPQARVVAQAMQTYGVIVADNGSAWYLSGTPDERWDNDDLQTLATLSGADFEAVAYNK